MRPPSGIDLFGFGVAFQHAEAAQITPADLKLLNEFVSAEAITRAATKTRGLVSQIGGRRALHFSAKPPMADAASRTFRRRVVRTAGRHTEECWQIIYSLDSNVREVWGSPTKVDWIWVVEAFSGSFSAFRNDLFLVRMIGAR